MRYLLTAMLGLVTLGTFYSCQKEISVEYGTPAKGSLQFDLTFDCTPKVVRGSYIAGKALNDSNYIEATVIVVSPGPYTINTDTANGYAFKATGTFAAAGTTTVRLKGSGTPVANGIDDFNIFFDSSSCAITVTVEPGGGSTSGCNPTLQGTYRVGTAMAATNQVVLTHTYTTAGPYTVSTDTVNGYYFGPLAYTATAGANNNITLTATGTPIAAGTNNFTVRFSDGQTCTFTVTVMPVTSPVNTDYFPTTLNSFWTYDDGAGADSFKVTVTGSTTFGSNTYQNFTYTGFYTGNEYYRKDASGFYYQSFDTSGWGQNGILYNQPRYELNFLKNSLTNGANWLTDVPATFNGAPVTLRYRFKCEDANVNITVNGKSFTNVYKIGQTLEVGVGTTFQPADGPYYYYYARGVGLINAEDATGTPISTLQAIRFWQVN